jgi:hypothetical protein
MDERRPLQEAREQTGMDEEFGPPEGLQYHERLNTDTNIAILQALHLRKGFNARDRRGRADIVYKVRRLDTGPNPPSLAS